MDMQPTIDLADEVARAADAATEPERARRLDGAAELLREALVALREALAVGQPDDWR